MIGIIDYNAGNLASVQNTLKRIGVKFFVSSDIQKLAKADKIIFPGVGNAKAAMENLRTNNLFNFLREYKKPLLGICLGMQLLFEYSEEGETECLGIIKGKVEKFNFPKNKKVIVPHMAWNNVEYLNNELFENIPQNSDFYFVHSYFCNPVDISKHRNESKSFNQIDLATSSHLSDQEGKQETIGKTDYEGKFFCSAVKKDNFYGVQFHPEKSGIIGQKVLENFVNINDSALSGANIRSYSDKNKPSTLSNKFESPLKSSKLQSTKSLKNMFRFHENEFAHFVTAKTYNNFPIFKKVEFSKILEEEIWFYAKKLDFEVLAYVIMPDHLHVIFNWKDQEKLKIGKIMQGIKTMSAKRIKNKIIYKEDNMEWQNTIDKKMISNTRIGGTTSSHLSGRGFQLWQRSFYDFPIYSNDKLLEKIEYIQNNPLKENIKAPLFITKNLTF